MTVHEVLELASFLVTVIGLPFAIGAFLVEQRRERENEEEEGYQLLSDAYNDFLKIVLANADLRLRSTSALPDPTPEQNERRLVIFDMLISLFERDEPHGAAALEFVGRLHARVAAPRRLLQRDAHAAAW
jgi:hypothetical protein